MKKMEKDREKLFLMLVLASIFIFALIYPVAAQPPPHAQQQGQTIEPNEFLDMELGADYTLARYDDIKEYFYHVGETSPKVFIEDIGPTLLGDRQIQAIIGTPSTIARLDHFKEINKKLSNPHKLDKKELERLKEEAKTIVMLTGNSHSTEIGYSQNSMEVLYDLSTSKRDEVKQILENTIVVLVPTLNPDGQKIVVDWYNESLDTDYEGMTLPYTYHKYIDHDINRDWVMYHTETRNVAKQMFQEWKPHFFVDMHEMGNRHVRFWVPPYFNPINPYKHNLVLGGHHMVGGHAKTEFNKAGQYGIGSDMIFDGWWYGSTRGASTFHNMVGMHTEAARVDGASPVYIAEEDFVTPTGLPDGPLQRATNFFDVWPGGWWHLRDIMDYNETFIYSLLNLASKYQSEFIDNWVQMAQDGVDDGLGESPYAYIIPEDQHDPGNLQTFLDVFFLKDLEVHQAKSAFTAGGEEYPEGTYVIRTSQPFRNKVMVMMDTMEYPDTRLYPDGPPRMPYGITGWTVPLLMDIDYVEVVDQFEADLARISEVEIIGTVIEGGANFGYTFGPESNNAAPARHRLLENGFELSWAKESFTIAGKEMLPGSTIVKAENGLEEKLVDLAKELAITFYPVDEAPDIEQYELEQPSIGLYWSWGRGRGERDAGWVHLMYDNFEIPFSVLRDDDIREGNLIEKFDVIHIANVSLSKLEHGLPDDSYPDEIWDHLEYGLPGEDYPESWTAGLGEEGLENLANFVEQGGTLITANNSTEFVTEYLPVNVTDELDPLDVEEFLCPGTVLKMNVDTTHPVGYGLRPEDHHIKFSFGSAFSGDFTSVANYPDENPMVSGWLLGPEHIQELSAIADVPYGEGRIVTVGFDPEFRGQAYSTMKILFNSHFYSVAK